MPAKKIVKNVETNENQHLTPEMKEKLQKIKELYEQKSFIEVEPPVKKTPVEKSSIEKPQSGIVEKPSGFEEKPPSDVQEKPSIEKLPVEEKPEKEFLLDAEKLLPREDFLTILNSIKDVDNEEEREEILSESLKPFFEKILNNMPLETLLKLQNMSRKKIDGESYFFNNCEYKYIRRDLLSRDFKKTLETNPSSENYYTIRICIFHISGECRIPFLEFLVERETLNINFPQYQLPTNLFQQQSKTKTQQDSQDPQSIFEQFCFQKFKDITESTDEIAEDAYRGYIEENNNIIYAVFDATKLNFNKKSNQLWSIIDEFINEKHVLGSPVDKNLYLMFHKNEYMTLIKDVYGEPIVKPCCLYLCQKNEKGDYENVYYKNEEERRQGNSIIEPITHETFGDSYIFTTDPFVKYNFPNIKRFANFIDNTLYVLNQRTLIEDINFVDEPDDIEDDDNDELPYHKSAKDFTCIYFFHKEIQLWCIRNRARFVELV